MVGHKSVSKSDVIRELYDDGYGISEIAKQLGIHYSFVHTVVRRYEEIGPRKVTKAEQIRELDAQGKTRKEIMKELGVDYSHIANSLKSYRRNKDEERKL